MPSKRTRPLFILFLAILFSGSLILLILFGSSFEDAQNILGNLSADGEFETLSFSLYQQVRTPIFALATLILIFAIILLIKPSFFDCGLRQLINFFATFLSDFKNIKQPLKTLAPESTLEWCLLISILLMAILARGLLLNNSLAYDEAYTYNAFVSPGLWTILTDYHVPNNHIFHSLLVWASTSIFGVNPLTLRLPAFLAGTLCVVLVYIFGTSLSNRNTGFISASAVSVWPWLVYYGKNARGYTLLTMFALLVFLAFTYLKTHKNHLVWFSVPILVALGGYTMPTMLYAAAAAFVWFFLSIIFNDLSAEYASKKQALVYLVLSAFFSILLTAILYIPILIWGTGSESIFNNHFLRTYPLQQLPTELATIARKTWAITFRRVTILQWPIIIGWVLHLAFLFRKNKEKVPQSITTISVIVLLLIFQRVVPYERTWLFIIPFLLVWSISGWVTCFELLLHFFSTSQSPPAHWLALLTVPFLIFGGIRIFTEYQTDLQQIQNIPEIALFLKEESLSTDWIVTDGPEDMPYQFYHNYYDLDPALLQPNEKTNRIFVVDSYYDGIYNQEENIRRILEDNDFNPDKADLEQIKIITNFEEKGAFYSLGKTMILMVPIK